MTIQDISIKQQVQQLLDELPAEGLRELLWFTEFLQFKYQLATFPEPVIPSSSDRTIPPESFTARYRGFVQSPLTVSELHAAYEVSLMGDDEDS